MFEPSTRPFRLTIRSILGRVRGKSGGRRSDSFSVVNPTIGRVSARRRRAEGPLSADQGVLTFERPCDQSALPANHLAEHGRQSGAPAALAPFQGRHPVWPIGLALRADQHLATAGHSAAPRPLLPVRVVGGTPTQHAPGPNGRYGHFLMVRLPP